MRDLEWYRQLEGLVENSPDGELTCGADGRITFANAKAADLLGGSRGELIGKTYAEAAWKLTNLAGEPLAEQALPPRRAISLAKPIIDFEHVAELPDGRRVVISANARPLVDEGGAVTQVILTLRDVTAHRSADEQIKESESHYRMLAESSDDLIFVFDRDEYVHYANGAGERFFEVAGTEVIGEHAEGLFGSELWGRLRRNLQLVFFLGRSANLEVETMKADHPVWLGIKLSPLRDRRGDVSRVMLVASDITLRKVAEGDLRASEQRFRTVLESAAAVVLVLSIDRQIIEINAEAERLYGVPREEAIGRDYFQMFLPEEAREAVAEDMKKVMAGEPTKGFENVVASKDGAERVVSWHVNRIIDDAGDPQGVIAIGVDVSARNRMEVALRASEQRYRKLFADSPVALWEADISSLGRFFGRLRARGVDDFRAYFTAHPEVVIACMRMINTIHINKAALKMFTANTLDDFAGSLETIMGPGLQPGFVEQLIALAEGQVQISINTYAQTLDGERKMISARLLVSLDAEEMLDTVIVSIIDITRQQREKSLDDALTDLNVTVTSGLEFSTIADSVVARGVDALGCDWGAIIVREGSDWVLSPIHGFPATTSGKKLDDDEFATIEQLTQPRQVVICDDVCSEQCLSSKLVREFGVPGLAIVPLVARENVTGAVVFGFLKEARRFSDLEISFMEKLGVSVGLAMENARHYKTELEVSQTLQETMLKMPVSLEGMTFDYLYESAGQEARVGGDFYDLFELDSTKIAIVVGDVMGKGLSAATTTSLVKNTVRAYAYQNRSSAQVMSLTNEAVIRASDEENYVTLFFGIIDKQTGAMTYASAGHPPALLRERAGGTRLLEGHGPAIGVFDGLLFAESEAALCSGDRLVLYTDGVIEARRDGDLFGLERLVKLVSTWGPDDLSLSRAIFDRVRDFSDGELKDDIAIVSVGDVPQKLQKLKFLRNVPV